MFILQRRHGHFIFAIVQSGMTSGISAAIASIPMLRSGGFLGNWLTSWALAWTIMLPIVIFAAPFIRRIVFAVTREDQ